MAHYQVSVARDAEPVVSFRSNPRNSFFEQAFNPSWIASSPGVPAGLLVRTQNCSAPPGQCVHCKGDGLNASVMSFARLIGNDGTGDRPVFAPIDNSSIVFGPHDDTDDLGTEDPRIVFDKMSGTYIMYYTCYNAGRSTQPRVALCLATSPQPTRADRWTRHGPVGLPAGSKSGALLLHPHGSDEAKPEHLLYWGSGIIRLSRSRDLSSWPLGIPFITNTSWGNQRVEPGPPPMQLSSGDWILFHNSWNEAFPDPPGYQPAWAILSASDPSRIVQRATQPLWSPQEADWMRGVPPASCNVPNVAFVQAAHPITRSTARRTEAVDSFRVYFGGADAVVGTAVITVTHHLQPRPRLRSRT